MHIVIFGSGIIGIFTAYIALQQGFKVTLIEKNSLPLEGASKQNGGQLSFSHILSISNINLLNAIIKNLYSNNHPININFLTTLKNYSWCYNFIKNSSKQETPYKELLKLSELSQNIFTDLINHNNDLKLKKSGTIQIFRNKQSFIKTLNKQELFKEFNIKQEIISSTEIQQLCPNLQNTKDIYKAIYFPHDMCADAYKFSASLLKKIQKNINFITKAKITKFIHNNNNISKCIINNQEISADHYILTPGSYINDFKQKLKLNIPITALKGYSFNHKNLQLKTSLIDHDNKIVYSPINQYTRVAGLYDFQGFNKSISQKRINFLLKNVKNLFPNHGNSQDITNQWCGFRPISVDKLPIIGNSNIYSNLSYNLGHANLGWTLSAASAKITIDNIRRKTTLKDFLCFSAQRFKII